MSGTREPSRFEKLVAAIVTPTKRPTNALLAPDVGVDVADETPVTKKPQRTMKEDFHAPSHTTYHDMPTTEDAPPAATSTISSAIEVTSEEDEKKEKTQRIILNELTQRFNALPAQFELLKNLKSAPSNDLLKHDIFSHLETIACFTNAARIPDLCRNLIKDLDLRKAYLAYSCIINEIIDSLKAVKNYLESQQVMLSDENQKLFNALKKQFNNKKYFWKEELKPYAKHLSVVNKIVAELNKQLTEAKEEKVTIFAVSRSEQARVAARRTRDKLTALLERFNNRNQFFKKLDTLLIATSIKVNSQDISFAELLKQLNKTRGDKNGAIVKVLKENPHLPITCTMYFEAIRNLNALWNDLNAQLPTLQANLQGKEEIEAYFILKSTYPDELKKIRSYDSCLPLLNQIIQTNSLLEAMDPPATQPNKAACTSVTVAAADAKYAPTASSSAAAVNKSLAQAAAATATRVSTIAAAGPLKPQADTDAILNSFMNDLKKHAQLITQTRSIVGVLNTMAEEKISKPDALLNRAMWEQILLDSNLHHIDKKSPDDRVQHVTDKKGVDFLNQVEQAYPIIINHIETIRTNLYALTTYFNKQFKYDNHSFTSAYAAAKEKFTRQDRPFIENALERYERFKPVLLSLVAALKYEPELRLTP